jgi:hypothetical protein
VWEFVRNNALGEASPTEWSEGVTHPTTVLPYHQNQFGATFGGPVIKNKLFFFGDYEGNRIIQDTPQLTQVPTALMHSSPGDFSELLNPALTGQSQPILAYEPNSGGASPLGSACGNPQNVMCASEISPIALKLFQAAYPQPNNGPVGQTYNNYTWTQVTTDITNQFDVRVDYNLSNSDQMFLRLSYSKEGKTVTAPLGPIFDGGGTFNDGTFTNNGKNLVFSWNHVFTPTLINQARWIQSTDLADCPPSIPRCRTADCRISRLAARAPDGRRSGPRGMSPPLNVRMDIRSLTTYRRFWATTRSGSERLSRTSATPRISQRTEMVYTSLAAT